MNLLCNPQNWKNSMMIPRQTNKDLRKLHIAELHALYSSSNINRNHVLVGNNPEMCTEF